MLAVVCFDIDIDFDLGVSCGDFERGCSEVDSWSSMVTVDYKIIRESEMHLIFLYSCLCACCSYLRDVPVGYQGVSWSRSPFSVIDGMSSHRQTIPVHPATRYQCHA